MYSPPLAYFITFTTYGTWLHGDKRTSVMRTYDGAKLLAPQKDFHSWERRNLATQPVTLDEHQRTIVLRTIIEHCTFKQWHLIAVHVRSNHIHIVVNTSERVDLVATALKSWSTRALRHAGHDLRNVWTRGASRRYVFTKHKLREKLNYVIYEQGEMMQYYCDETTVKELAR
jgi:REP element-mobilizing transposase RayT